MGVAVLNPQDCLKQPFSHIKYPRNPSACPKRNRNNTRRSPPRNQTARSTPPPPVAPPLPPPRSTTVPKGNVKTQIRILKRGEEIQILPKKKTTTDLVVENSDLGTTKRIGPDPVLIPSQIRLSNRKSKKTAPFYAGPVTMTSPPPSDVPLPAFFTNNCVSLLEASDIENNLKKMLNLIVTA